MQLYTQGFVIRRIIAWDLLFLTNSVIFTHFSGIWGFSPEFNIKSDQKFEPIASNQHIDICFDEKLSFPSINILLDGHMTSLASKNVSELKNQPKIVPASNLLIDNKKSFFDAFVLLSWAFYNEYVSLISKKYLEWQFHGILWKNLDCNVLRIKFLSLKMSNLTHFFSIQPLFSTFSLHFMVRKPSIFWKLHSWRF